MYCKTIYISAHLHENRADDLKVKPDLFDCGLQLPSNVGKHISLKILKL